MYIKATLQDKEIKLSKMQGLIGGRNVMRHLSLRYPDRRKRKNITTLQTVSLKLDV